MQVREATKLAKTLGATVAVALLAVPVAQARLDPGAEPGTPVSGRTLTTPPSPRGPALGW
jgi:hypothetical protein